MFLSTIFVLLITWLISDYIEMLYEWLRKVKVIPIRSMNNNNNNNNSNNNAKRDKQGRQIFSQAPGPMPWPIIGNLALLGQYEVPFQGFTELSKKFGDIYCLTLGSTRTLIVNNLELIREVLNQNGKSFGGRPDFVRYTVLFGGDRSNCELHL